MTFALLLALGVGVVVRLMPTLPGPLTTGDGGLIVVMVDDLRRAGFVIPDVTTYNLAGIPFLYPPLALYATAALAQLFGLSSLDAVRIVAALMSVATLIAFAVLARRLLPPAAAVGAVFVYALMPHAYDPIVAGGGVTRGAGLLFAILALIVAAHPTGVTARRAVALGVLLGLAALSHPQVALYAATASTVLILRPGGLGFTLRRMGVAALAAGLVMVPWLLVMSVDHGLLSILSAGHRWNPILGLIRLFSLLFSGSAFTDLFLVVGGMGLALELLRREWRLPLLLFCLVFAGQADFIGAVPWSLLGGVALGFVFDEVGLAATRNGRELQLGVALVALFLALVSSLGSVVDDTSRLQRVTGDQASAMTWARDETAPDTQFVVATVTYWGGDEISEWFPAIAERRSVATVQGSEWLGAEGYETQLDRHFAVIGCSRSTDQCFADWTAREGLEDAWLFVPKGQVSGPLSASDCCPALRELVRGGGGYEVVYDGPGATIGRPRP